MKKMEQKRAKLVAACPREADACGVPSTAEERPSWRAIKEMAKCLKAIDPSTVEEDCAPVLKWVLKCGKHGYGRHDRYERDEMDRRDGRDDDEDRKDKDERDSGLPGAVPHVVHERDALVHARNPFPRGPHSPPGRDGVDDRDDREDREDRGRRHDSHDGHEGRGRHHDREQARKRRYGAKRDRSEGRVESMGMSGAPLKMNSHDGMEIRRRNLPAVVLGVVAAVIVIIGLGVWWSSVRAKARARKQKEAELVGRSSSSSTSKSEPSAYVAMPCSSPTQQAESTADADVDHVDIHVQV